MFSVYPVYPCIHIDFVHLFGYTRVAYTCIHVYPLKDNDFFSMSRYFFNDINEDTPWLHAKSGPGIQKTY